MNIDAIRAELHTHFKLAPRSSATTDAAALSLSYTPYNKDFKEYHGICVNVDKRFSSMSYRYFTAVRPVTGLVCVSWLGNTKTRLIMFKTNSWRYPWILIQKSSKILSWCHTTRYFNYDSVGQQLVFDPTDHETNSLTLGTISTKHSQLFREVNRTSKQPGTHESPPNRVPNQISELDSGWNRLTYASQETKLFMN